MAVVADRLPPRRLHLGAATVIMLGLSVAVPVAPEARLTLFDCIAALVCLFNYRTIIGSTQAKMAIRLGLVYIVVMLVTTLIHGLPAMNFGRRAFVSIVLLADALALYVLLYPLSTGRRLLLVLSLMLGLMLHYFYPSDARVVDFPIKFLLGIPLGVAVAYAIIKWKAGKSTSGPAILFGVLVLYALYCVLDGSRSIAGVFVASAFLSLLRFEAATHASYRRRFPLYLVVGVLGASLLIQAYEFLAMRGVFGEVAEGIANFQVQFFGSIILGGRPEIAINLVALRDAPFIGHGAIAEGEDYRAILSAIGIYGEGWFDDDNLLYHSMLFGAGHEGGILCMLIWAYLAYKIAFAIPVLIALERRLALVTMPILVVSLWNILFSPLIPYNRWPLALAIAVSFIAVDHWQSALQPMVPRARQRKQRQAPLLPNP